MNLNKIIQSSLIIALLSATIYMFGCASAETNTGKIAFQKKEYEKAAEELKKGLAKNSTDAEGWYMLGVSLIETGSYKEGAEALRKSLSISNAYGTDIQNFYIEKFNTGINKFNAAIETYKTDKDAGMKGFTDASNYFIATTTIFPDSVGSQQMLADTYVILGKTDEALTIYQNILDKTKSPQDAKQMAKIITDAGKRDYDAGNYDKAIETFTKVTSLQYLPADDQNLHLARLFKAFSYYKIAEAIAAESGVNEEAKENLNNSVAEAELLVSQTTDKGILTDTYGLMVSAYDALGMMDKKDEAQAKLDALNQ